MSVKIRMRRMGAKNDMSFRVVATDSRSPRDGRYLELLGWYDPEKKGENFGLKLDRIEYWKSKGAIISDTVKSLLRKAKKAGK
ncbi:MAG: 30S ribosomal protein S16 [Kiritimatiellae bacterium]|nr:30S ribosomal protein S16 [Kiritimatiellia bacterium]MDD5520253.1 30S ribosomal protein S16 [Kiritimatiellia bacterium]